MKPLTPLSDQKTVSIPAAAMVNLAANVEISRRDRLMKSTPIALAGATLAGWAALGFVGAFAILVAKAIWFR